MATKTTTNRITENVTLLDIVRFERINIHIPMRDGKPVVEYFGAIWFVNASGQRFVSFVKKTTKLWQTVRVAEIGTSYTVQGNVKEHRIDDEHGDRIVITFVKIK